MDSLILRAVKFHLQIELYPINSIIFANFLDFSQLNLNRITTNPEQTRASDPALYVNQPLSPETSLVGRGTVSFVAEDRSDCREPDRRSLD